MANQMKMHEWLEVAGDRISDRELDHPAGILELVAVAAIAEGLEPGDHDTREVELITAAAEVLGALAATAWSAPERIALDAIASGEADPDSALYTALVDVVGRLPAAHGGRLALSVYLTPAEWARLHADPGPSSTSRRVVEALDRDRRVARLLHMVDADGLVGAALEPGAALERMRELHGLAGTEPEALA